MVAVRGLGFSMTGPQGMGNLIPNIETLTTPGESDYDTLLKETMTGLMWYCQLDLEDTENDAEPMGGEIYFETGGWRYLKFNSTQPFWTGACDPKAFNMLVVGGGGAAGFPGDDGASGGGGGGQAVNATPTITDKALVTIGAGANAAENGSAGLRPSNGSPSSVGAYVTAAGGGSGGASQVGHRDGASSDGSGGGAYAMASATVPRNGNGGVSTGTGFRGGNTALITVTTSTTGGHRGGGGGGAGEQGDDAFSATAPAGLGHGGDGVEYPVGSALYWAGGGAGGRNTVTVFGGLGGGGDRGSAGTPNTGGGGGGTTPGGGASPNAHGGSGVVLIRVVPPS